MIHSGTPGISVLIPTWNGASLLREFLPPLRAVMQQYPGHWECVVVDDGSTDDSLSVLASEFPWVRVVSLPANKGFSRAFNAGLKETRYPLILSLNNDVRVFPGFLEPLLKAFQTIPDLFGAASLQYRHTETGKIAWEGYAELAWKEGCMVVKNETEELLAGRPARPGYICMACALVDRAKLVELQGMNEIFSPFYWEDTEVSVRAGLAGWKLCFCPDSKVEHCHGTTARKKSLLLRIVPVRNFHLFHWLLLDDPALWREHMRKMMGRILRDLLKGKPGLFGGLLLALPMLPAVCRSRRRYVALRKQKLAEILVRRD